MSEENKIKELVLAKRKEGKVVFATFEGLMSADLEEFIKQPAECILHDLNRDATTVLTLFIDGEKWVNDFAVGLVITKLKEKLEAVEYRLHTDAGESADLNELEIAKNALEQIVGYYRRSHKHGKNTCYAMCLEAERAFREMSLLTQREADYSKVDPISRTWDTPEEDETWRNL